MGQGSTAQRNSQIGDHGVIGEDAVVATGVVTGTHVSIGHDAQINKNCRLESGTIVQENAKLSEGCLLDAGTVVGQGARLGAGCRISYDQHRTTIGKESDLGTGTTITASIHVPNYSKLPAGTAIHHEIAGPNLANDAPKGAPVRPDFKTTPTPERERDLLSR